MNKAIILAAALAVLGTPALSQSSGRDRDDDDRRNWRDDRREDRDRDDMRRSMRDFHGRHHRDDGPSAARFVLRSGDARMAVRCDDRESMRACVDAAITLFDRVRTQQGTSGATSSSPTPLGSGAPPPPAR